jgi:hypothetical protein
VWLDGEYWRIATGGLLHGSAIHLLLNVWSLIVVGEWVERAWGKGRLLLGFGVSSLAGCVASVAWAEAPMIVGASAGIMGLAGILLVVRLWGVGAPARVLAPLSARGLGIAVGVLVALGFAVPVIAQAGHLGGLAAGGWIGWAWSGRRGAWLGWVALAGMLGGLAWGAATPRWRSAHAEYLGFELLDRERYAEAAAALETVLAERPDDAVLQNAVAYGYAVAGIELERAEALVVDALEEEPNNPDYLDTLGWVYCRQGRVEAGLATLERASEESGGAVEEIEGHLRDCAGAQVGG